jgi:hypothetical protein
MGLGKEWRLFEFHANFFLVFDFLLTQKQNCVCVCVI